MIFLGSDVRLMQALGALLNLALDQDKNVVQLAQLGLVRVVLQLLEHQTKSNVPAAAATVHSCLDTVLVLSTQESGRTALAAAEPWSVLGGVLSSNHTREPAAARSAFAVIGNLATSREAAAALLAQSPQAVSSLLSAVRQHKPNAEVQEAGCGALRNLASSGTLEPEHSKVIDICWFLAGWAASLVELDGAELLVELIAIHEGQPAVLQNAISALMALAQGKQANQVKGKVRKLGAIPLIKAAMQMHEDVESLQGVAMHMLRELGVKF